MRVVVKCKNCGIVWERITAFYDGTVELTEDLQYVCPKCSSNWCEPYNDSQALEKRVASLAQTED